MYIFIFCPFHECKGLLKAFQRVLHFIKCLHLRLILKFLPGKISAGYVRCFWVDEGLWGHGLRLQKPLIFEMLSTMLWLESVGETCTTCFGEPGVIASLPALTDWSSHGV